MGFSLVERSMDLPMLLPHFSTQFIYSMEDDPPQGMHSKTSHKSTHLLMTLARCVVLLSVEIVPEEPVPEKKKTKGKQRMTPARRLTTRLVRGLSVHIDPEHQLTH